MALATALRSGPARIFRFGPGLVLHLVLNQGQSEASLISVRVCPKHKAVTKPSHCVGARLLRRACHARPTVKYEVVDKLGHRYQYTLMSHVCVRGPLYLAGPVVALDLPHRTVGICWYKMRESPRAAV